MPKRCSAFACRGNYGGTPYVKVVSFPKDPDERERWILAMPNEPSSLRKLKEIYVCESHFDCDWMTAKGGKRPKEPPTIFPGVPKSALKQVSPATRPTSCSSSDARSLRGKAAQEAADKIKDFNNFVDNIALHVKDYSVIKDQNNLYLSKTDKTGQMVEQFYHFQHISSHFGFLFLNKAEKDGMVVPKKLFPLQKNSLISQWSQIQSMIKVVNTYESTGQDKLHQILAQLHSLNEAHDHSQFSFLLAQLKLMFKSPEGRRFDTNTMMFSMQLHNISPSAYRMIRRSGLIILPSSQKISQMLSGCSS